MKDLIIEKASTLFFSTGYKATSLQTLAEELGIKPASLYYYFPGGKEEIYIDVLNTRLKSYRDQIISMSEEHKNLESFLKHFAYWFVAQPTMNMSLISQMDMPHLSPKGKQMVTKAVQESIFVPLRDIVQGHALYLKKIETMRIIGIYITLLNGMSLSIKQDYVRQEHLVEDFLEIMLRGVLK